MTAADAVADNSFVELDDVIEKWSQLSPKTLMATVQRDGLFVGHGGVRHDMNADIAESFFVRLFPAWTAFFEHTMPTLIRQFQGHLVAGTERALTDLDGRQPTPSACTRDTSNARLRP